MTQLVIPSGMRASGTLPADACESARAYMQLPVAQRKLDQLVGYTCESDTFLRMQIQHAMELAYLDGMHDARRTAS